MGLVEMIIAQRLLSVSRQKGDLIRFARGFLNPDLIRLSSWSTRTLFQLGKASQKKDPTSQSNP